MKKFAEQIRQVTERTLMALLCDFCGKSIPLRPALSRPGERVDSITIEHEQSVATQKDILVSKASIDCCGECWPVVLKSLKMIMLPERRVLKYDDLSVGGDDDG